MNDRSKPDGSRRAEDATPRYSYWKARDRWTIIEATCLLIDAEPDANHGGKLGAFIAEHWYGNDVPYASDWTWAPPWARTALLRAREIRDLAGASETAGTLHTRERHRYSGSHEVSPLDWLAWARDKDIVDAASDEILKLAPKPMRESDLARRLKTAQLIMLGLAKELGYQPGVEDQEATGEKSPKGIPAILQRQLGDATLTAKPIREALELATKSIEAMKEKR